MDVSGVGVQTISPTTGTTAQNPNPPPPDRSNDNNDTPRVSPSSTSDTGKFVDKIV